MREVNEVIAFMLNKNHFHNKGLHDVSLPSVESLGDSQIM